MIVVSKWSQLTEQSSQLEGFCFQLVQCSMKTSNIANNYCYVILSKIRSVAFWKKSIYGILKVFIKVNCVHVCTQVVSDTWTSTVHKYQPCPQATPRFYLAAVEENREKAQDQNYVTDRKWWTRLVGNVDSVCTDRVHHFRGRGREGEVTKISLLGRA